LKSTKTAAPAHTERQSVRAGVKASQQKIPNAALHAALKRGRGGDENVLSIPYEIARESGGKRAV
jgi:transcriptional/translational regulatory protein YebC/TACO1